MEAWTLSSFFHSLFANSDFYHLLITFANRDQHNVGVSPDLLLLLLLLQELAFFNNKVVLLQENTSFDLFLRYGGQGHLKH